MIMLQSKMMEKRKFMIFRLKRHVLYITSTKVNEEKNTVNKHIPEAKKAAICM